MDRITPDQRSYLMSQVRAKDTKPELVIRSFLHRSGFRFRLHVKSLPGTPDIVLPKYKTVIEVRGCFWHRHPGCRKATTPASNCNFWHDKFQQNVTRDAKNDSALEALGWQVIVVWECQIRKNETLLKLTDLISRHYKKGRIAVERAKK